MKCPFCKQDNDKVIDTRLSEDGFAIRRRRECAQCSRRFTTYERVEEAVVRVVKKGGSRVPYDRQKILTGVLKACEKRPITTVRIEEAVNNIEQAVFNQNSLEVSADFIGEQVMNELKELDHIAYVRFASVYREFKDVTDFVEELQSLNAMKKD